MGGAEAIAIMVIGVVAVGGLMLFMGQGAQASTESLAQKLFGGTSRGIQLRELPEGYQSPTLDKIRTKSQLDRSEIPDFIAGIKEEIGANYVRSFKVNRGLHLGQMPGFVPPGHRLIPGVRRRRGLRSNMAIHYE